MFNKTIKILEKVSWIAFLSMICIYSYNLCINRVLSFDGAMNLQVPVNLIRHGQYAGNYPFYSLFPAAVQTGWPVLLPIALLFLIFGISDIVALSISSIFLLILVFMLIKISKRASIPIFLIGLLLCWILFTPDFMHLSVGIYGEIPALTFILFSIYLLYKYNNKETPTIMFFAGSLVGLAYSTKTVALIVLPSFLFIFALKCFIEKKLSLKMIVYFFVGGIIPSLVFELYKIYQEGFEQYLSSSIILIKEIFSQAGVSIDSEYNLRDTFSIFEKVSNHLTIFSNRYETKVYFIITILLFNSVCFCCKFIKDKYSYLNIITLLALSYFVWWLGITPTEKTYQRRILIGGICLQWSTIYFLYWCFACYLRKFKYNSLLNTLISIYLCFIFYPVMKKSSDSFLKNTYLSFTDELRKLDSNNTVFCGIDWWQSPIVSFYLDKKFCDLHQIDPDLLDNKSNKFYFISSERSFSEFDQTLLPYASQQLLKRPWDLKLFSIDINKPYNDFSEEDIINVKNMRVSYKNANMISRRIYKYDESVGGYWVQNEASLLLRRRLKRGNKYIIKYRIPANIYIKDYNSLSIKIGNNTVYYSKNEDVGEHKIIVNVPNEYLEKSYVDFHFESNIEFILPHRELRRGLSFILLSCKQKI